VTSYSTSTTLPAYPLWERAKYRRALLSFDLELTARCNNDCRHCYINQPAGDTAAREKELSLGEIERIAGEAVNLGAVWCLITGGEPLLRPDFAEIYLMLKKKGLLVSVFTNACLVTAEHARLFQQYPPRGIEVTVYGATPPTYERVTRRPGSYAAFRRGLDLLLQHGVKVGLKAMALRSNVAEMAEISRFCRALDPHGYRFDPLLHLRYDGDPRRNAEILAERLSPENIAAVEQADPARSAALEKSCAQLVALTRQGQGCEPEGEDSAPIFRCGAGATSFSVGYDGTFRLCSSLNVPGCTADLRRVGLAEAWRELVPRVRALESEKQAFRETCHACPLASLCMWCPANAYLEVGQMDGRSETFCQIARARLEAVKQAGPAAREEAA
jgi:radical SAM protein with 4Fe4S-binding SPASM domain